MGFCFVFGLCAWVLLSAGVDSIQWIDESGANIVIRGRDTDPFHVDGLGTFYSSLDHEKRTFVDKEGNTFVHQSEADQSEKYPSKGSDSLEQTTEYYSSTPSARPSGTPSLSIPHSEVTSSKALSTGTKPVQNKHGFIDKDGNTFGNGAAHNDNAIEPNSGSSCLGSAFSYRELPTESHVIVNKNGRTFVNGPDGKFITETNYEISRKKSQTAPRQGEISKRQRRTNSKRQRRISQPEQGQVVMERQRRSPQPEEELFEMERPGYYMRGKNFKRQRRSSQPDEGQVVIERQRRSPQPEEELFEMERPGHYMRGKNSKRQRRSLQSEEGQVEMERQRRRPQPEEERFEMERPGVYMRGKNSKRQRRSLQSEEELFEIERPGHYMRGKNSKRQRRSLQSEEGQFKVGRDGCAL